MVDFSKFNKQANTKRFNIETAGLRYETLNDLYVNNGAGKVYVLAGVFINTKSKFGEAPILATADCLINAPAYLLDVAREMMSDGEYIDAINNGKCGFKIYSYRHDKFNRVCYGIEFVNLV